MIVVDSRESSKTDILKYVPNAKVETLEVGDYIIFGREKNLIIERKTVQDLLSSAYDRLWEQMKSMSNTREQGFEPFVIIEGEYVFNRRVGHPTTLHIFFKSNPEKEITYYSVIYAITSFNVQPLYTVSFEGTCRLLTYLDSKLGEVKEGKGLPERRGFKREWSIEKKREYLFEAFGFEFAKVFKNIKLRELLQSPLTKEQVFERLPKTFLSGKRIPSKTLEEFLHVIGYP
ncbi:MAG: ERCC4 domain-containing protein [Fervidobacterium sp.]